MERATKADNGELRTDSPWKSADFRLTRCKKTTIAQFEGPIGRFTGGAQRNTERWRCLRPLGFVRRDVGLIYSIVLVIIAFSVKNSFALGARSYITAKMEPGEFVLSASGKSAPLCVSENDHWGVKHALMDLQSDIRKVTGCEPQFSTGIPPKAKEIVVAGTISKSSLIDELIKNRKINVRQIDGKWESFIIEVVNRPFPGVDRALVIVGSDMLGTIYGIYDVSEKIGVSPWYWWDNVPPQHHAALYVKPGTFEEGPPTVKFRGIFLNDEAPDLTNWVIHRYGFVKPSKNPPIPPGVANYGHKFYEHVFDLLLRLKANYLWPAMWNNAFNEDDSLNPVLANKYGIYMGTSHQEPMMRAQKEWDRRYMKTLGNWNFAKYPDTLTDFWKAGIERNKNYREIVTIGLRGENDTPMIPGGTLKQDTTLLGKIVRVQEGILADEMNPDPAKIPQLWCPYDEVLSYFNAGFRVPSYVTILWPDDNYGDLRRLPTPAERKWSGGAGIYYHFDLHGGPRCYEWINTNALPKIWDQMTLASEYGANRIWIVNVGHLKGYSLPISYFMNLAWDAKRWTNSNIVEFARLWARQQFGPRYENEIAHILMMYSKYNARKKPELLSPTTYSIVNYNEAENVVRDYKALTKEAEKTYAELPADERDAFYETVLFPTKASCILNDLYYAAGRNELYAKQGRATADDMASRTHQLFDKEMSLINYFNDTLAHGEWHGFMDQPVLGYTSWNQPRENSLRAIHLVKMNPPDSALMGVAIQGSGDAWPGVDSGTPTPQAKPVLPQFDPFNRQTYHIDVFNRGKVPFHYTIRSGEPYVKISAEDGEVTGQRRVHVTVDWKKAPEGTHTVPIEITQSGTRNSVIVYAKVSDPSYPKRNDVKGFVEGDGFVSIEAAHYTALTGQGKNRWINVQDYGRTLSGMRATSPVDYPAAVPGKNAPCLEYRMYLFDSGKVNVEGIFGPSLNFNPAHGLKYAIAFDNQPPKIVTVVPKNYNSWGFNFNWALSVMDNARYSDTSLKLAKPGYHTLKIWMVNPGLVLEKIVVKCGPQPHPKPKPANGKRPFMRFVNMRKSYLGPPESFHRDVMNER